MTTARTLVWLLPPSLLVAFALLAPSAAQAAETTGPAWKVLSVDTPTTFTQNDQSGADAILVSVVNVGGSAADGTISPVTIVDSLPKGLAAVEAFGVNSYHDPLGRLEIGRAHV